MGTNENFGDTSLNYMKKRRNPVFASALSAFVFAGAGQIYNKQYKKGIVLLIIYGILLFFTLSPFLSSYINYLKICTDIEAVDVSKMNTRLIQASTIIVTIFMMAVWLYSVIDAYIYAKKYNNENRDS